MVQTWYIGYKLTGNIGNTLLSRHGGDLWRGQKRLLAIRFHEIVGPLPFDIGRLQAL